MSSEFAIQTALFTVLSDDAALTAIGPDIVDFGRSVDDAATVFPFVEIGTIVLGESDTKNTTGFNAGLRIHTLSNSGSAKQTRDIQGAIYDALHRQDVSVTGFNSILLYREQSDVMRAASGAFHGVCEYRWLLTKT